MIENPFCDDFLSTRWNLSGYGGWSQKYTGEHLTREWWGFIEIETSMNYPQFMNQHVVEGRFFNEEIKNEAVINEVARHFFSDGQPVGKILNCNDNGQSYTIVGVIDDRRPEFTGKYDRSMQPAIYVPIQHPTVLYVKAEGSSHETSDFIMKTVRQYLPENFDYHVHSLSDLIRTDEMLAGIIFRMMLIFSAISLIIGLSGVYSSVSLNTKRRRKEIAIRKINGASLGNIIGLFLRKYILLLLIASIPAFIGAYAAIVAWLETQAYRASLSLWWFVPVFTLMAAILTATVLYHLQKTARSNPAEVLKSE